MDGHKGLITALAEVVDGLVAAGPGAVCGADDVVALERQLARLEAAVTGAVAAFEASGAWGVDGAQNAASWLAVRCSLSRPSARRRIRLGHHARVLPEFAAAWQAGEITGEHLGVVGAARRPGTEEAMARDEGLLLGNAKTLRFEGFTKTVAYWLQLADPDGAEDEAEQRQARRDVWLRESFQGAWFGKITLDPISGTIVNGELERLTTQLFEADWAAARARLGREPLLADLDRTPGQRRADALIEMATRSASTPPDSRRPAPLFSVIIDLETLRGRVCELASGTVLAPGQLLGWLDSAYVERVVFGLRDRVEVSASARLFSGATRRAVELRDRQCQHPFCDRDAERCQGDHVVPFAEDGRTTQDNGQLLCGFHNRLKQRRPPPGPPEPDDPAGTVRPPPPEGGLDPPG